MTISLRGGQSTEDQRLDRLVPTDWRHVERFSIRALAPEQQPRGVPVVCGFNWYSGMDRPRAMRERGRTIYVIDAASLGGWRGGHAFCLEPAYDADRVSWWEFYDQGSEGACVGFAWSRCMSLLYRQRYEARWLYHEAQRVDEWEGGSYEGADPVYEGTSVRAGADVLRGVGHRVTRGGWVAAPSAQEGIVANRWARTADEVLQALGTPDRDYAELLNSWGRWGYPHRVRIDAGLIDRLLDEYGEAGIPTAR